MILKDKVAIVTGASRGIGRSIAEVFVREGAKVVIVGRRQETLDQVASEIGPNAKPVACHVGRADQIQNLVDVTTREFGRIDILVNNAGIIQWAGLPDVDQENLERHLSVHVLGSFNTTRAAWPHMVEQGYGRIVMTTSSGIFGLPKNLSYATAKGGVIGLTRSIATMSESQGIKVNLIAPAAMTRMAGPGADPDDATSPMAPGQVAPLVAFLAHEACPVNGEMYAAGAGRFARIFIASTPGYVVADPSIEDVAEHWDEINDDEGYVVPRDLPDWSSSFLAHLQAER
jgi:NAD(P)-dependent dehydrogenase (short-subunit alcohol dehydrogenase family)